jgi:hypothetical protein
MLKVLRKRQPYNAVRIEQVLGDFDRLLPLYEYVEGDAEDSVALKCLHRVPFCCQRAFHDRNARHAEGARSGPPNAVGRFRRYDPGKRAARRLCHQPAARASL